MKHYIISALILAAATSTLAGTSYEIKTTLGTIEIELEDEKAPISTKNFDKYVEDKFYDGTIFHRVIDGFMIQGGGLTADMKEKNNRPPIENEAKKSKLKNVRGTLAMARTNDVNSATSQFFINVKDNDFLNHQGDKKFGYAVFGKVTKGMDVVDKIKAVKTGVKSEMGDVPLEPVTIESVKKIGATAAPVKAKKSAKKVEKKR